MEHSSFGLPRTRFLAMLGALPVAAGCADHAVLPSSGLTEFLMRPSREHMEIEPTVGFPLLRPDGTRPELIRQFAEPFATKPRKIHYRGMGPDGSKGSTTVGNITTYGYYDQHYYESYFKSKLGVQIYLSHQTSGDLKMKYVTSSNTASTSVPTANTKLPIKLKYVTICKTVTKGHYKLVKNSNNKKIAALDTTVSPATITLNGGLELNCPGAWAWAYFMEFCYAFDMEVWCEEMGSLCGPICYLAAWIYTQQAEENYDQYMESWAQDYCDMHGEVKRSRKSGFGPNDSSGSSGCDYGSSAGSSGGSSGGWSSGGGGGSSGGTGGCIGTQCPQIKLRRGFLIPGRTLP